MDVNGPSLRVQPEDKAVHSHIFKAAILCSTTSSLKPNRSIGTSRPFFFLSARSSYKAIRLRYSSISSYSYGLYPYLL